MNILKNRAALGLICIVLSLIVCFGLTPLFNGAVRAQTEIVRVTGEINQGDMITANMVAAVKVGGYNLPGSVMKEKENVVGRYAKYDMQAGDYILAAKLSDAPVAEFAYLSELDGTRAAVSVTIKSFAAGLSGKLESGDIVTLIASGVGDFQETIALPELRYVKVLAVTDGKGYDKEYMGRENDSEEKELPAAVTLLALPAQALLLAELENTGKIHCALVYRGAASEGAKFLKIQDDYLKSLAGEETPAEETEAEVRPDGN